MGSKLNPGKYDCIDSAAPDEPMFVLLGRDTTASVVVALWVKLRGQLGVTSPDKLEEARDCASALERWARDHDRYDPHTTEAFEEMILACAREIEKDRKGGAHA